MYLAHDTSDTLGLSQYLHHYACSVYPNHSQGKMFLYLFFALLNSLTAIAVDEAVFFSTDYACEQMYVYVHMCVCMNESVQNNEMNLSVSVQIRTLTWLTYIELSFKA